MMSLRANNTYAYMRPHAPHSGFPAVMEQFWRAIWTHTELPIDGASRVQSLYHIWLKGHGQILVTSPAGLSPVIRTDKTANSPMQFTIKFLQIKIQFQKNTPHRFLIVPNCACSVSFEWNFGHFMSEIVEFVHSVTGLCRSIITPGIVEPRDIFTLEKTFRGCGD